MKTKTKSDQIREYLLSLPVSKRSPTAAAKQLKAMGCRVTRNHVSVVKSTLSRGRAPSTKGLVLAKKFIDEAGSPAEARRLISIVGKILGS